MIFRSENVFLITESFNINLTLKYNIIKLFASILFII